MLDRAARGGELFWGGAIPFYDTPQARAARRDTCQATTQATARAVEALYAEVDAAVPGASQLDRMIGIELRQRLPELLLMRVDKVTMGSSLEARVPYLDHKLVEFALAIPADVKYRHGVTKWVLKRVAERVGLDRELVYRSKRGFCGSASNMLSPRLLERAEQEILDSPLARERFDLALRATHVCRAARRPRRPQLPPVEPVEPGRLARVLVRTRPASVRRRCAASQSAFEGERQRNSPSRSPGACRFRRVGRRWPAALTAAHSATSSLPRRRMGIGPVS